VTQRRTGFSDTSANRRGIFYLKTDIPVSDSVLQGLRKTIHGEALKRCKQLVKVVEGLLGAPVKEVTPASTQGTFHLIHHVVLHSGEQLIARSTTPGIFECDEGGRLELYAQHQLASLGLPSLTIHALDLTKEHAPFEFLVTDIAQGITLTALGDKAMDDSVRLAAIGAAMRQWHQIPASGGGLLDVEWLKKGNTAPRGVHAGWYEYITTNLDQHVQSCLTIGLLENNAALQINDWFAKSMRLLAARPVCMLHGDPGNHNLFMDGMRVSAVVDWEDTLAGDPLYDVAFWASFHPARRWQAFLDGYGIADSGASEFSLPFALYFLRVTLAKLVHRHRFGYADTPGRPSSRERLAQAVQLVKDAL